MCEAGSIELPSLADFGKQVKLFVMQKKRFEISFLIISYIHIWYTFIQVSTVAQIPEVFPQDSLPFLILLRIVNATSYVRNRVHYDR